MLTLRTSGNFTVVRQIANHLDSDTNYVQAVIRNAYTDTILDTLNLSDKGGQRFSKNWKVPVDPSGEGFYISIVTSVYSDSGYTTKNSNYGDEENTYLVADAPSSVGKGATGLDARTVRRILQEELAKLEESKVEEPEVEEMPEEEEPEEPPRWDEVLSAIEKLNTTLKPEKPEKVELQPLFDALQSILSAVNEKEVTEPTDISPILEKLGEKEETDEITRQEVTELLNALGESLSKELPDKIASLLGQTTFKIAETTAVMDVPKEKAVEPVPFDISKISI